jgi:hypothetical protein
MEDSKIIGIRRQGMGDVKLGPAFRREHRTRIDAPGPGTQKSAIFPKDGTQSILRNGGNLTDKLELIIIKPGAHRGIELGQDIQRLRGEKSPFAAPRDIEQ